MTPDNATVIEPGQYRLIVLLSNEGLLSIRHNGLTRDALLDALTNIRDTVLTGGPPINGTERTSG